MVEIEVIEKDNKSKVRMKIGKSVVNLPHEATVDEAAANIKRLPSPSGTPMAKIPAKVLIEFIKRSQFCIPVNDNGQQKFAMGVLHIKGSFGYYTAQATDGFIVAAHKVKQAEGAKYNLSSLLIPIEALDPLYKLLQNHKSSDVGIFAGERDTSNNLREVFFSMEGVLFGTVLRVGAYPNVQTLLDSHAPSFEIEVPKDDLKGALLRAAHFVENNVDRRIV